MILPRICKFKHFQQRCNNGVDIVLFGNILFEWQRCLNEVFEGNTKIFRTFFNIRSIIGGSVAAYTDKACYGVFAIYGIYVFKYACVTRTAKRTVFAFVHNFFLTHNAMMMRIRKRFYAIALEYDYRMYYYFPWGGCGFAVDDKQLQWYWYRIKQKV